MSTRSLIAKQIGEDEYLTIYCHSDGYLTYNGAMLLDHYNTPEKVDALLELGDISSLRERLEPEQNETHSFENPLEDVTIAYRRDRGEKNTEAEKYTLKKLDNPEGWHAYVYIFTDKNEWKFYCSTAASPFAVASFLSRIHSDYFPNIPAITFHAAGFSLPFDQAAIPTRLYFETSETRHAIDISSSIHISSFLPLLIYET